MVDEAITKRELIDAKRDARDLGKAVNEKVIVSPRYGNDFKSLPMIAAEAQNTIGEWRDAIALITQDGGVPALAVSDASGKTQQEINNEVVLSVFDYTGLNTAKVIDGQAVLVKKDGIAGEFLYNALSSKNPDGGTVIQDSQGRIWERIDLSNPKLSWWGAVGDGVTDDTLAIQAANLFYRTHKIYVDGDGKTYASTTRGAWLRYLKNATVRVDVDSLSVVYNADGDYAQLTDGIPRGFGRGEFYSAKLGMCMNQDQGYSSGVYIGGFETLKNVTSMTSNILIGDGIMSVCNNDTAPRFNIAIGDSAMTHAVNTGGGLNGTRNIALGSLALHFMTNGTYNTAIGRNSQHNTTTGSWNTTVGYAAGMMGYSPVGWSGKIEMQLGTGNVLHNTVVGGLAYQYGAGSFNTIIGKEAGNKLTTGGSNTLIGAGAGINLDSNIAYNGKLCSYSAITGTYSISGNTVTVTLSSAPNIGLSVGDDIGLGCTSGDLKVECGRISVAAVVDSKTFTFNLPPEKSGAITGGSCVLRFHIKGSVNPTNTASSANIYVGRNIASNKLTSLDTVALGNDAIAGSNANGSVLSSVAIGARSLSLSDTTINCVAVGCESLRLTIDGSNITSATNITGIGYQVRASGDNQIQLGNSLQTTYTYGAVQDRSDIRDKADIEEMPEVMTEFVLGLNPVQGVWDMRDDYVDDLPEDWTDEQRREWWSNPEKDGSKKRNRKHNWFIAQEVKVLADKLGVDFAGLQDHKLIDGTDTYTIGYEEFIPPIVSTLQKVWKRLDDIDERLSKLEK